MRSDFSSDPFHSGPGGLPNPFCGYFSNSGMHNLNRHIEQWAKFPYRLFDLWNEDYLHGKSK